MSLSSSHKLPETKGAGRVIPKLMAKHCFRFGVFLFFSFLFFLLLTGIHRPGVEIPLLTVSPSTCLVRHANTSCCFEPLHNSWQRRRETKKSKNVCLLQPLVVTPRTFCRLQWRWIVFSLRFFFLSFFFITLHAEFSITETLALALTRTTAEIKRDEGEE